MQQTIYLAGGCFWGVQGYFDLLKGVLNSQVGYANSKVESPSYQQVCSGATQATEAVEISFDSTLLSLEMLLKRFFSIINPFALNYQGNDIGTQYRSGIYTQDTQMLKEIKGFVENLQKQFSQKIVTEVSLLENFYSAEAYHQKYLAKNPNGYCHIDLSAALKEI
ncbi:peptide-methionine (S)-S-oxide reductase MsrA [Helicobacter winghamensis]|uniref:Peptide methionine sulfoxide reductase MsrA n=1 Tax=Helicobacter winghamensis TaxID=157268 RepID=A0A2N3PKL9_9HELI|nr:peptide-methionine (S)-S-oxide reductase MsrA [Helicobacter winghamensis]EEO25750.1 peptide-methionine (S)-S-oxide reductase [Helicobacter winghamensis ATCC BAA-430]PKT78784.1 peptide-methionine (S)-S-oxide reductase [Helicobacter winghamensis]PKT78851.1 peptide-methionine (S)-S-oxide reductase [Helicobacter winghamensis]PKT78956.1 peptide-methionine (S)-S-oxide reductase [Helicobacter winghamensis]PKT81785.1 peptide-methionine (S)-S-oxide reductase [Helicobacter winghamensis]